MKKLFQADPTIEIQNCRQLKLIGNYRFLEASERHCALIYEGYVIKISAEQVHIDVLKEEECLIRLDQINSIEMKKQVK